MSRPDHEAGWQRACRQHVESRRLDPVLLRLLAAFASRDGPADAPGPWADWRSRTKGDFHTWEQAGLASVSRIRAALVERLSGDVDRTAGEYYARRFQRLVSELGRLADPGGRVLRLGVLARMTEVLQQRSRRSSRVRDVLDFYYGYGSVLHHRRPGLPRPRDLVRAARWRSIAAGIEHAHVSGLTADGPMHANLLRARSARLEMLHRRETSVPFEALVADRGAVAGISGGYTLCSTLDIEPPSLYADPVGLLMCDGIVYEPPVFSRAAVVQGPDGIGIETVGPVGLQVGIGGSWWTVTAHNDPAALASGPATFNRIWGPACPPHAGWSLVFLGRRLLRVAQGAVEIPKAGLVLTLPTGTASPPSGASVVDYRLPARLSDAMAGGPMLLEAGEPHIDLEAEEFAAVVPPYTFSADETNGHNLLPRMVAGVAESGDLVLVAVDGRNFSRGIGLTLRQCAEVLKALGCRRAMNLDGGDSKRMVVDGRIVDLPAGPPVWEGEEAEPDAVSRHTGVRPVHTAVLLHSRG